MVAGKGSEVVPMNQTSMELRSDREIVIARTFNGPARIVFDAWTRPALVITVTFDEHDGKTHLVSHSLCPSQEVRDAILASGMEHGMRETMDQLDELVASPR
jgi:uncharacterized protein YndB with AHSA1/START domain